MTWLFWWIRSWFCAHTFQYEERWYKIAHLNEFGSQYATSDTMKVSATCIKCGWHRAYNKFK